MNQMVLKLFMTVSIFLSFALPVQAEDAEASPSLPAVEQYLIGNDDILQVAVLQPDELLMEVTVQPDGYFTFPYIGNVLAKDSTLENIQKEVQSRLADGYMKYPVVSVTLKESRSKRFFVYGEVTTPGAYPLDSSMTVFKALSVAGGFSKFGSSSRVKVMRLKTDGPGYEMIKVDIKAIMNGSNEADIVLKPGDTVVVSEGIL